jgi:hypothetical protein
VGQIMQDLSGLTKIMFTILVSGLIAIDKILIYSAEKGKVG